MGDMEQLKDRLELLPTELYDYIYKLTFTADPRNCTIDTHYCPPTTLQVSQSTRLRVAQQYYSGSRFYCGDHVECLQWLLSIPKEHVTMLREVHCESVSCSWMLDLFDYEVKMQSSHVFQQLQQRGVKLRDSVLCFKVSRKDKVFADYNWTRYL